MGMGHGKSTLSWDFTDMAFWFLEVQNPISAGAIFWDMPGRSSWQRRSDGMKSPWAKWWSFLWKISMFNHFHGLTMLNSYTLWLFNIAMENGPFMDDLPVFSYWEWWFSMAMLNNQMVDPNDLLHFHCSDPNFSWWPSGAVLGLTPGCLWSGPRWRSWNTERGWCRLEFPRSFFG